MDDQELKAMSGILEHLADLDDDTCARVLRWVAERRGLQGIAAKRTSRQLQGTADQNDADNDAATKDLGTFADLYYAASPSTSAEKAMVGGYWHQIIREDQVFTGAAVNKELQNVGEALVNVTDAFNQLMAKKPKLAIQTKKSGKSQQSRKQYKLTEPGIVAVEAMLKRAEV